MRYTDLQLCQWLSRSLGDGRDDAHREVVAVRRTPAPYGSSWQMEHVSASFRDGGSLSMILKDLSPEAATAAARGVRPSFVTEPMREIETYRIILEPANVGAPGFLGAAVDPGSGRYLLALEEVEGVPLWQVGNVGAWKAAAAWLARLHAGPPATVAIERADDARLLRYDQHYYMAWIGRAVQNARSLRGGRSADRTIERLRLLAERYEHVVAALLALPVTFTHGEYQPSNVIVQDGDGAEPVVRPVDWEMAALAPAPMDVADITAGRWTADERRDLVAAYLDAGGGRDFPDRAAFDAALDLCRLHRAIQWSGWASPDWSPPAAQQHDWLAEALSVADRLGLSPA